MKKDVFSCRSCGPLDYLLFDAGTVLDRDFEGMKFIVTMGDDNVLRVDSRPEDAEYLSNFNMEKHLEAALDRVDDGEELQCPTCLEWLDD